MPPESTPTWLIGPAVPPTGRIGTVLAGTYRLDTLLGEGSTGITYNAWHLRQRSAFAVKLLRRDLSHTHERALRLRHDLRALAGLAGRGFLAVELGFTPEGAPFLASELLRGETLRQALLCGPLPMRRAGAMAVAAARALRAAHGLGVVHGDVRPEQIFLPGTPGGPDGAVAPVLLDAALHNLRKQEGGLDESVRPDRLRYLSPDLAGGGLASPEGDQFALGAILYECLAGQPAFAGTELEDLLERLAQPPPRLAASPSPAAEPVPAGLYATLDEVIARACAHDPAARFSDLEAFAAALSQAFAQAGVTLAETTARETTASRIARRSTVVHKKIVPVRPAEQGDDLGTPPSVPELPTMPGPPVLIAPPAQEGGASAQAMGQPAEQAGHGRPAARTAEKGAAPARPRKNRATVRGRDIARLLADVKAGRIDPAQAVALAAGPGDDDDEDDQEETDEATLREAANEKPAPRELTEEERRIEAGRAAVLARAAEAQGRRQIEEQERARREAEEARAAKQRVLEAARAEVLGKMRVELDQRDRERAAERQARREAARLAAARLENERREAERLEREQAERARSEAHRAEQAQHLLEQAEAARWAAEQREAVEREAAVREAELAAAAQREAEQAEAAQQAAKLREVERTAAAQREAEQAAAAQREAEQAAAAQREAEQAAAAQREAEQQLALHTAEPRNGAAPTAAAASGEQTVQTEEDRRQAAAEAERIAAEARRIAAESLRAEEAARAAAIRAREAQFEAQLAHMEERRLARQAELTRETAKKAEGARVQRQSMLVGVIEAAQAARTLGAERARAADEAQASARSAEAARQTQAERVKRVTQALVIVQLDEAEDLEQGNGEPAGAEEPTVHAGGAGNGKSGAEEPTIQVGAGSQSGAEEATVQVGEAGNGKAGAERAAQGEGAGPAVAAKAAQPGAQSYPATALLPQLRTAPAGVFPSAQTAPVYAPVLSSRPARAPQSAQLRDTAVVSRPIDPPARDTLVVPRYRVATIIAAAAVVLGLAGATVLTRRSSGAPSQPLPSANTNREPPVVPPVAPSIPNASAQAASAQSPDKETAPAPVIATPPRRKGGPKRRAHPDRNHPRKSARPAQPLPSD